MGTFLLSLAVSLGISDYEGWKREQSANLSPAAIQSMVTKILDVARRKGESKYADIMNKINMAANQYASPAARKALEGYNSRMKAKAEALRNELDNTESVQQQLSESAYVADSYRDNRSGREKKEKLKADIAKIANDQAAKLLPHLTDSGSTAIEKKL